MTLGATAACDCARCGQPILVRDPCSKPADRLVQIKSTTV